MAHMTEVGPDYWRAEHPHPLAPNRDDVETYRSLIGNAGSVLLLGNTPALMPLCTAAMDTEPFLDDPRVIAQDWTTNSVTYDVIIGDGVLNFTDTLAEQVLEMVSRTSGRFIARSFNERLPIMRVADNFPSGADFALPPAQTIDRGQYSFFIWDF